VEVCLDGAFEREYRKFESVILAGLGAGKHREEVERPPEGLSERGERGELVLIEDLLCLLGWHLFGTCSAVRLGLNSALWGGANGGEGVPRKSFDGILGGPLYWGYGGNRHQTSGH
jgi:hypothetical protein